MQLWTHLASLGWQPPQHYTFTACNTAGLAQMFSPTPGSVLGQSATFTWNRGINASAYWLDVGTVSGKGDIFAANAGPALSQTVNGIPSWTQTNGAWYRYQYSYNPN